MTMLRFAALASALALAACGNSDPVPPPAAPPATAPQPVAAPEPPAAAEAFLAALRPYCGQAFAGRITANEPPPETADPFDGKALVMHVRECDASVLRIPFHVGDDHSRTWVLTRIDTGLRLKHDHRHADGSDDAVTMYGGDTSTPGTAARQEFPVDAESVALFEKNGLGASVTNIWAMEIEPGQRFVYELGRPGRLFRVEFDLTAPVTPLPPAPWGAAEG
jgi:hypothetical protein